MNFRFLLITAFLSVSLATGPSKYQRALDLYNHTSYEASLKILLHEKAPDAATLALIGQNYYMLGDAKRASEFFQKAVNAEPLSSNYHHWLGRAYGRRAEVSSMLSALGNASKARQNFEKAVELDPNNTDAVNDLFEYYLEAPGFMGGGLDKATLLADRIAARDPAEANYAHARIDQKRKEFGSAEKHLRRAMELAPHQVGRLIDLASFLAKQGRFEESDETFVAAEKLAPNTPKLMYARAATYIETKRNIETARELLEKYLAAQVTPDDPPKSEARKLLLRAAGA